MTDEKDLHRMLGELQGYMKATISGINDIKSDTAAWRAEHGRVVGELRRDVHALKEHKSKLSGMIVVIGAALGALWAKVTVNWTAFFGG